MAPTSHPLLSSQLISTRLFLPPIDQGAPGTIVSDLASDRALYKGKKVTVKGFATIDNVVLINVEGTGMVGVPGIASSIFSTVRDANINVIMISQASSEQSICFAVKKEDGNAAVYALQKKFEQAIGAGRVSAVQRIDGCCVLAAVGQGMVNTRVSECCHRGNRKQGDLKQLSSSLSPISLYFLRAFF